MKDEAFSLSRPSIPLCRYWQLIKTPAMERTAIADTREFVLCFDGTGYKFRGDDADSNVLKIYRVSSQIGTFGFQKAA